MTISNLIKYMRFDNGLHAVAGRTIFRSTGLQVLSHKGMSILCDHRADDAGSILTCLQTPMYSSVLPRLPDEPLNILDLGANAGGFSLMLLSAGVQVNRLVAVELNPNTAHRARFNLESNCDAATVLTRAITHDGRDITADLGNGSTGDSIYRTPSNGHAHTIRGITITELVDMFDGPIDLCKMDIEGAESELLLQGDLEPWRMVNNLVTELHHAPDLEPMTRALESVGLHPTSNVRCGVNVFVRQP